jgi:hypothetical protein
MFDTINKTESLMPCHPSSLSRIILTNRSIRVKGPPRPRPTTGEGFYKGPAL